MNYDNLNTVHDFWRKEVLPHLSHNYTVESFNEYLKRFSFLPSGKWLRELNKVKLSRIGFAVECEKFVKKYKEYCVAYNTPSKPEEGLQRIIYQISPTLHLEVAIWVWMENKEVQHYASMFACYGDEKEFLDFLDEVYKKMRKTGNTEEKANPGFANL